MLDLWPSMWQVINTHVSWVKSVVWLWNVENRRSPLLPSSGSSYCFACLSLSMWWQSLRAGPSFNPMYFIIMSLLKSIKALPSISCGKAKQSIYYKIYSSILFWKSAKNNWKTWEIQKISRVSWRALRVGPVLVDQHHAQIASLPLYSRMMDFY